MNREVKPKKLRGGRVVLVLFLVCLILAVPFVTNGLLIGRVTSVNDLYAGDGVRMEYAGGKVFVSVENRGLFRWLDRLLTGQEGAYVVGVYVKDPRMYAEGTRVLALVRGGQEDSIPPGLGAWWIAPLP